MHIDPSEKLSKNYEMIIETDLMQELKFTLGFNKNIIM